MAADAISQAHATIATSCQIFSGTFFAVLVGFFVVTNSSTPLELKRLPIDIRWQAVVRICMFVCVFSCYFNFFQLTDMDDVMLPRSSMYTLDLARPIEWIMTCPLMQLVLVILCGDRVPDYRLYMMPLLSLSVLLLGVLATQIESEVGRGCVFSTGALVAMVMFFFNWRQIGEATDGEEGFFSGSSEIRYLSVVLIVTWFPFPLWFLLSPEGADIIQDFGLVQIGWSTLNIIAKGSFSLLLQRYKMRFFSDLRLDAGSGKGASLAEGKNNKFLQDTLTQNLKDLSLHEIVDETMDFLGMAERADVFKRRLQKARLGTCPDLDALTEATCKEARIPWELVYAVKRRMHAAATQEQGDDGLRIQITMDASANKWPQVFERFITAGVNRDLDGMERVIAEAKQLGAGRDCLEMCRARHKEIRNLQTLCGYMSTSSTFQAALKGRDAAEVQAAVDAAAAAGLGDHATEGRAHLTELEKRAKACKAGMKEGIAHFKQGKFDLAVDSFSDVLKKDPEHKDALLNRAASYIQLKHWAEVDADTTRCLEVDPSCEKAYRQSATAFINAGKKEAAAVMLERGLAKFPGSADLARLQRKAESGSLASGTENAATTATTATAATQTENWAVTL